MQNIQTEVSASTPSPTPTTPPVISTPMEASNTFESGGAISNDKIQWFGIAIVAISIISLVYKALYYNKAIRNIGATNNNTTKKLNELEKNIRALRGDKYETVN